jgi:RHS repeat-associated protein
MMLHAEPQSNIKDRIRLHYYLRDHLGNTVVAFDDRNYDGAISDVEEGTQSEVIGRYHYYSFGMQWNHAWVGSDIGGYWQQRYRYNGKELHSNSGLLDYGFRYYDPSVGRFTGVDPLAEKMPGWSSYSYGFNAPTRFIDPDGRAPIKAEDCCPPDLSLFYAHKLGGAKGFNNQIKVNQMTGAGTIVGVAAFGAALAPGAVAAFIGNEIKDEFLSQVTGGLSDVVSISKQAKNLVQIGGKKFAKSLDDIKKGYDKAGYKIVEENKNNIIYEVPTADGSGTFYSRLQKGSGSGQYQGDRVVNTVNNGNTKNKDYVNPDGSRITGPVSPNERKEIGHIHLND